jgi:hypothetical protein
MPNPSKSNSLKEPIFKNSRKPFKNNFPYPFRISLSILTANKSASFHQSLSIKNKSSTSLIAKSSSDYINTFESLSGYSLQKILALMPKFTPSLCQEPKRFLSSKVSF